jgi:iron complex outermembrane recepter protein
MSEWVSLLAALRAGRRARRRATLATVAVGVMGALNATVSLAADERVASASDTASIAEGNNLEEIVVTARKRTENLRDIPASITAISAATIEEAHITQLDDLNSQVTNLYVDEAHDNTPDVTLRGVGSFGVVQGVGFYANDVQLFEGQIIRPIDIERIEVLKGPQGTLFGGANAGGAIKYVTKDPTSTWDNEATVEFGQYDTRNYQAVLSGPLDDKVGVRASLYYDTHGGYIFDTYHKTDYGDANDHGGRLTLVAAPTEATKIHVWVSGDVFNTSSQNLMYTPPDAQTYYYSVNDYFYPEFTRHIASVAVQLDQKITEDVALTSLSSFFTSFNRGFTDFNKKPIPLDYLQQNADNRVYSEELRLASSGNSNLDWLVGAFFQGHKSQILAADNNYNGDPLNPVLQSSDSDVDNKIQREYALFGDATYHYGNWQYELGLRAEYYLSSLRAVNTNNVDPITSLVLPIAPNHLTGHEFSPKGSVQYKFSPTLNVYATIARGFTPADEIEENFVVHPYRPEIVTNYEVGVKSLIAHSVQFDAAVFYTTYADRLYLYQQLAGLEIVDLTTNVGPSKNYGAEFDISSPLPAGFNVSAGMGVLRAVWGDVANYVDPATSLPIDIKGRYVPNAPAYTANTTLEWKHNFGGCEFGSRVSATFIGRSYWDPQDAAYQQAYDLVNASAWIERGRWKLSANVTNLTRTEYNTFFQTAADVGAPFNIARVNRPEWFTVSASVRF